MAQTPPPVSPAPTPPILTAADIQEKPWRYIGYKGFSEWMGSEDDFFVVRRFDTLSARVVLLLQWELTKLETQLSQLDHERSHEVIADCHNGRFEADDHPRQACIKLIQDKLSEYHAFVVQYSQLRSLQYNGSNNIKIAQRNVQTWLINNPETIDRAEADFINGHNDLATMTPKSRTPLRSLLEKLAMFRTSSLFRENPQGIVASSTTIYTADQNIEHFVNTVICVAGFFLLAAPLWILFYMASRQHQLIVITVFVAFFLAIIQSVSVARPFESLAATAAYSALLMVFMQITPQGG